MGTQEHHNFDSFCSILILNQNLPMAKILIAYLKPNLPTRILLLKLLDHSFNETILLQQQH